MAATSDTRFIGVLEAVTVETPADALGEIAVPVTKTAGNTVMEAVENWRAQDSVKPISAPAKVRDCRSAHFCKVYLPKHRTVILQNIAVSPKAVKGVTLKGTPTVIFLRKGIRVEPLGANCEGKLVPLKDACRCNATMAAAVEHSKVWAQ